MPPARRKAIPPVLEPRAEEVPEVPGGALDLTGAQAEVFPREVLFRFDGRAFTIPTEFDRADAFTYVHLARKMGIDVAADWAMELALGAEDYAVFRGIRGLSQEQNDHIVGVITRRVSGAGADPKS